ncbi:interferon-induced protein 44-like [Mya arenaria]|uniref:interferon-induced protein 44-like n=1 Tax=Mya arenaria TaxID=6604 RepID=UPI0022E767B1|nr:interferon-induced protein 44-like [Mya arenaria]
MNTFGKNFEAPGLQSADINNGTMDVIELEVYIVTDGMRYKTVETQTEQSLLETSKCWRKTPDWNQQLAESLCKELGSYKCPVESNSGDVRILLLGPVGSGKSGFVNTVQSAFFRTAPAASASWKRRAKYYHTESAQFKPYRLRTRSGGYPNIRLCDIPGMTRRLGFDITELGFLLDGNVPEQYTFNPCVQFTTRSPGFVHKPPRGREVHCVALVVDTSPDMETESAHWLKTFTRLVYKRGKKCSI